MFKASDSRSFGYDSRRKQTGGRLVVDARRPAVVAGADRPDNLEAN